MPQVEVKIGGRTFDVACQAGEEPFLKTAAATLDVEATSLSTQVGRMPESRMLLMAGLLLADRTTGLEDKLRELQGQLKEVQSKLDAAPAPVDNSKLPVEVADTMFDIALIAERLADEFERLRT